MEEKSLHRFIAFLTGTASEALAYQKLDPGDRADLERAAPLLTTAINEIEKLVAQLAPADAEHVHEQFWRALGAAYLIGAHGNASDSARLFWRSIDNSERAQKNRTKSPFTVFIEERLKRNPKMSAKEIEGALAAHPDFRVEDDRIVSLQSSDEMKFTSLAATVSKVRRELK